MAERICEMAAFGGFDPDEQGQADLVLQAKNGQELRICVCPDCLGDLIAHLVLMRADLLRRRSIHRREQEQRSRLN